MKSARETKLRNFVKDKLSLYSARVSNMNSRNQSNAKCTKTNKIIKHTLNANNNNSKAKNKSLNAVEKYMHRYLRKYNCDTRMYNTKIINDIIYDEKKHIVSLFRNFLLWDETSDFLKRFYYRIESIDRLPRITAYYEQYTLFPPVYFALDDVVKIMLKNVKKKKKYLEMIEENEDNVNRNSSDNIKEFNYIINPNDINTTVNENSNGGNKTNSLKELNMLIDYDFKNDELLESFNNIDNFSESKSLFDITNELNCVRSNTATNTIVRNNLSKNNKKKVIEIKKLDFKNIIPNTTIKQKTVNHKNLTERLKLNLPSSTASKKTSTKPHIVYTTQSSKQKPKTNLVIPQKTLINHITNVNVKSTQPLKFNTIENMLKLIHFPNKNSRMSSQSKNKKKQKANLVINTISNANVKIRDTSKKNKSSSIQKKLKINTTNQNVMPSSIYNINLNLNLGHSSNGIKTSINNSTNNKKCNNSNTNNIMSHNNSNSNSNPNANKQKSTIHTAFLPKKKTSKTSCSKHPSIKNKEKISYDLNLNNVHISIRKQPSVNSTTNQGVNININCGHGSGKMSRNDNKGIANMQSTQTNKAKHRVIPIKEESTMKKRSIGYHENSVSLGKLRKKIKIDIGKKYPLTSRNEKESIPFELITKIIKKLK